MAKKKKGSAVKSKKSVRTRRKTAPRKAKSVKAKARSAKTGARPKTTTRAARPTRRPTKRVALRLINNPLAWEPRPEPHDEARISIVRELVEMAKCHTVLLYGSRAKKSPDPQSDYDVLGIISAGEPSTENRLVDGVQMDARIF